MGQSIQEWTKYILWKTTFKKFEGMSTLEYFVSYAATQSNPTFLKYDLPWLTSNGLHTYHLWSLFRLWFLNIYISPQRYQSYVYWGPVDISQYLIVNWVKQIYVIQNFKLTTL